MCVYEILVLNTCTASLIHVLLFNSDVPIIGLIAFMILIIIEKMLIFIEGIINQKVDIISNQLSVHI